MDWITGGELQFHNTCVAFGRFDGLHRGHMAVICRTLACEGLRPVLVLLPGGEGQVLTTEEEKRRWLEGTGLSAVATLMPEELQRPGQDGDVVRSLAVRFGAQAVVTGPGLDGNCLEELRSVGCRVIRCEGVLEGGEAVSATRIRRALECRDPELAGRMLGRPYTVAGRVVHGHALGRTVGMPTANLRVPEDKLLPAHGVYATRAQVDGETLQGITNIGMRPTVDRDGGVTVETMLLDFDRDIYGKTMELELLHYVRDIRTFNGLEEVKRQVERDIAAARDWMDGRR